MIPEMYPFQKQAVELSLANRKLIGQNDMIVIPTGCGKTRIPAEFSKRILETDPESRFLFLAHRDFLLTQAVEEFQKHIPKLDYTIFDAKNKDSLAKFVFASKDSLHEKNLENYFTPIDFDYMYSDECHHNNNANVSYIRPMQFFKRAKKYGYTATPYSESGSLSAVWNLLLRVPIHDMIRQGFLCPAACIRVNTNCNLAQVRRGSGHDGFNQKDLQKVIDIKARNKLIVDSYEKLLKDKTTIIFALNKEHVRNIVDEFRARGYEAEAITEETPRAERERITKRLSEKTLKIVVNCMILTEGFNVPSLESIMIARPLGTLALTIQIIGRVLRKCLGKDFAKIVIINDRPGGHKLFGLADIVDGFPETEIDEEKLEKKLREKTEDIENKWLTIVQNAKIRSIETEDLFRGDKFIWVKEGEDYVHHIDMRRKIIISPQKGKFKSTYIEEIAENEDWEWLKSRSEAYISTTLPVDSIVSNIKEGSSTTPQRTKLAKVFKKDIKEIKFLSKQEAGSLIGFLFGKDKSKTEFFKRREQALVKFYNLQQKYLDEKFK